MAEVEERFGVLEEIFLATGARREDHDQETAEIIADHLRSSPGGD